MILIFGGTTEGRMAASILEEAGKPFYYSTLSNLQKVELHNGIRLCGGMDTDAIATFCNHNGIRCIIDAAHPFAEALHHNIAEAALSLDIPAVRLQRTPAESIVETNGNIIYCSDFADATQRLLQHPPRHLLALSGANTIARLKDYWQHHPTTFRILDRAESRQAALEEGFHESDIIYYNRNHQVPTLQQEVMTMQQVGCDAIITKDSGENGGLDTKLKAAEQLGIVVYIVKQPQLPDTFITVSGRHTLRRAIEHLLPDFFPLRTGITTGACAAAAAKAALMALTTCEEQESVEFSLPDGEVLSVDIASTTIGENWAEACVTKDAGDDPDVTNGCTVRVRVEHNVSSDDIIFRGGKGVGTVTLPGLGLAVGEPAINNTPRRMITDEIRRISSQGYIVTIGVDNGEEIALRTFNSRVGVVGGISIIGTSGIVSPFSNEAFIESIGREIEVAKAIGCTRIVINSGAKSERILKNIIADDNKTRYIHYGNFIGETIKAAVNAGIHHIIMGIMPGKAVKLAEGHLDTHSHKVVMNRDFVMQLMHESDMQASTIELAKDITMMRELWEMLTEQQKKKLSATITHHCYNTCSKLLTPETKLEIMIVES